MATTSTIVARDCFARAGLARSSAGPGCCAWCGQERRRLYCYVVEDDSGRRPILGQPIGASPSPGQPRRAFCGLRCFRNYAG